MSEYYGSSQNRFIHCIFNSDLRLEKYKGFSPHMKNSFTYIVLSTYYKADLKFNYS